MPVLSLSEDDVSRVLDRDDVSVEDKKRLVASSGRGRKKAQEMFEEPQDDGLFVPTPKTVTRAKAPRTRRKRVDDLTEPVEESMKFVPLGWLLPPLPQRGSFDVSRTKNSLYFFS